MPVIGVGRINTPEVAEDILAKGSVDLVGIGRQLLADHCWPRKVLEGKASETLTCDSCYENCYDFMPGRKNAKPGAPLCEHNHRVGHEWEVPPHSNA